MKSNRLIKRITQAIVVGLALPFLILKFNVYIKIFVGVLVLFLVSGNRPHWICIILKTLPRDLQLLRLGLLIIYRNFKWRLCKETVAKSFMRLVKKNPQKIAFYSEDGEWSYGRLNEFAVRFAACLPQDIIIKGEPIALAFGPKPGPRLVGAWLGLAQRGAPSALIPPEARMSALKHTIIACKTKAVVFTNEMSEAMSQIQGDKELEGIRFIQYNMNGKEFMPLSNDVFVIDLENNVINYDNVKKEIAKGSVNDQLIYIYTSGTTGLPKATVITNARYMMLAASCNSVLGLNPSKDIFYTTLPLHHSAGGIVSAGQSIIFGVTVVQRNKFSASKFWNDCATNKCTVAQYIGEMCRFLLVAHKASGIPVPKHKIRAMIGNGLKASIWKEFQTTFRIPAIREFYGSTEGNVSMANIDSQEGAIGAFPRTVSYFTPNILIKCQEMTGEPIRNSKGLCIKCKPGEPGLLLGKMKTVLKIFPFAGYVNEKDSAKKLIRDVLTKGDCYFNTGDVLMMDELGYFYFKDRTGDTFRWRGENVSTAEVEGVLSNILELTDLVVYGVQIPNVEGKAGMAAIVDKHNKIDLEAILPKMNNALPTFARPLFIRLLSEVALTATYKINKTQLQKEGFNINIIADPIYFLDNRSGSYVKLDKSIYEIIIENKLKL